MNIFKKTDLFSLVVYVFLSTFVFSVLLWVTDRNWQGLLIIFHGLFGIGVGLALHFKADNKNNSQKKISVSYQARLWFTLYLICWGFGDVGWALNHFISNRDSQANLSILFALGCPLSFIFGIFGLLNSIKRPLSQFINWKVLIIALLASTPVVARIAIQPFVAHAGGAQLIFNINETVAIAGIYGLLTLSFLVLLSSENLYWSVFAAALVCLLFGDLAIRVDKITGETINYGLYSFLVLFGYYTSAIVLFCINDSEKIERFDETSLFSNYKAGIVSTIIIILSIFSLTHQGSPDSLKVVCFGSAIGALFSVFVSHFITAKITLFTFEVGRILQQDFDNLSVLEKDHVLKLLPKEVRNNYDEIFLSILKTRKIRGQEIEAKRLQTLQTQVSHDIRSPLAALDGAIQDIAILPEQTRILIRSAVYRINDIANLLTANSGVYGTLQENYPLISGDLQKPSRRKILLSSLIELILSEKRLEYRSRLAINIETTLAAPLYGIFAFINDYEMKRVISNLINNSIEAMATDVSVRTEAEKDGTSVTIVVSDNGEGINSHLLAKLGNPGVTYGKQNGSGVGLFHAKSIVEQWAGRLEIISSRKKGTEVRIHLPVCTPPAWFVPRLSLFPDSIIIILDDDSSIHHIWDKRFQISEQVPIAFKIYHFSVEKELFEWISTHAEVKHVTYLIDYELLTANSSDRKRR